MRRTGNLTRYYSVFFLFLAAAVCGQVNIYAATDLKEVHEGEAFNLIIILEANGNDYVQESKMMMPDLSKFNILGTGSNQNTLVDKATNTVINQQVFRIALEAKNEGTYKIGSALVQFNGKMYKTEPFDIVVRGMAASESTAPKSADVSLHMTVQNRDIYERQPTVVIVKAYSTSYASLQNVGPVDFADQPHVDIRPISFTRDEISQERRSRSLTQIVAVAMAIPQQQGDIVLQPAVASYKTADKATKLSSNRVSLNVKPLPANAPAGFRKTVGDYQLSLERGNLDERIEVNKPVDVVLKISGSGNLQSRNFPKLIRSEDYTFFHPRMVSHFKNTEAGIKGNAVVHYVVVPKVAGDIVISTEDFSFFDPEAGEYRVPGPMHIPLRVLTPAEVSADKTALERVNEYSNQVLDQVNTPAVATRQLKVQTRSKLNWTTVFTNYSLIGAFFAMLVGLSWLARRLMRRPQQQPAGSVAESEKFILDNKPVDIEAHAVYLKKLAQNGGGEAFFADFDELNREAERFIRRKTGSNINSYIEKNYGASTLESYRELLQQLRMEKYVPMNSAQHLTEMVSKAEQLYREIL